MKVYVVIEEWDGVKDRQFVIDSIYGMKPDAENKVLEIKNRNQGQEGRDAYIDELEVL